MTSRQQLDAVLDPRLGAAAATAAAAASSSTTTTTTTATTIPPTAAPPPIKHERPPLTPASYAHSTPPQPYYHYPTPTGHTSQQLTAGAPGSASQSTQASPADPTPTSYGLPLPADAGDNSPGVDDHAQDPDDPKRPRACEACRGLKVRCDQDTAHPELPCRRCQKANRPCIITAPSRKRQKKSDGRVAELEKKLDALTAVLQQQNQHQHQQYGQQYSQQQSNPPRDVQPQQQQQQYHQQQQQQQQQQQSNPNYHHPQYASPHPPPPAEMLHGRPGSVAFQQYLQPSHSPASARPVSADQVSTMQPPHKRRRIEEGERDVERPIIEDAALPDHRIGPHKAVSQPQDIPSEDFVKRINQLVSSEVGISMFNRYVTKLAPHMPAVVFPPDTTAEQVWRERPILYVCILSATSAGTLHPDISNQLAREAMRAIADHVVWKGTKSLELIQAMQVLALWYKPPEEAEQTNFYQIIHMAAVMAIDIGLGKRFNAAKSRRGFGGPHAEFVPGPHKMLPQNSDTMEARRAWLCCYYLCASASMVLRRPNLLRWSHYMKECIDTLESSQEAFPSDKLFCQHLRVQHICEDIGLQFLMDDNTATISITDPKVSYALNVLENDLKAWEGKIPTELKGHPGLGFFKHVACLYLHEIALHFNHNVEDFQLPFTEESLKAVNNTSETLTQNQMAALESCRRAAHGILDAMLSFDVDTVKTLPMLIFFVRCTYALVILIKMHVAITTPGSEIGKIMTAEDVRVDHYVDSLMQLFHNVASEQEFRTHPKILRILSLLRDWFRKHQENLEAQNRGEQPPNLTLANQRGQNDPPSTASGQAQYNQTPLHVLSQLATGNQQERSGGSSRDWTFNSPYPLDYACKPEPGHPDSLFPAHAQNQQQHSSYQQVQGNDGALIGNMADQYDGLDGSLPVDYLWGTGFEQAMEINLGDMSGLSGTGMGGLFLRGGMGPFNFNGEVTGTGQWQ